MWLTIWYQVDLSGWRSIDVSESEYIDSCKVDQIGMGQGCVNINISKTKTFKKVEASY